MFFQVATQLLKMLIDILDSRSGYIYSPTHAGASVLRTFLAVHREWQSCYCTGANPSGFVGSSRGNRWVWEAGMAGTGRAVSCRQCRQMEKACLVWILTLAAALSDPGDYEKRWWWEIFSCFSSRWFICVWLLTELCQPQSLCSFTPRFWCRVRVGAS